MTCWAVYSDVNEDGRRVRHVYDTFPSFLEAASFVKNDPALRVRRCESEGEARGLEISNDNGDGYSEDAVNHREFEYDTGYFPSYGAAR